ncbi:MAG TPA: helix-turn-helix domain-containing protein [Micromonosporaceae bacterium]
MRGSAASRPPDAAATTALTWSVTAPAAAVRTALDLAGILQLLRQREARVREGRALTYRDLAAKTGWSRASIGEYLAGTALPPADRFDELVRILGATRAELGPLANARDRVEELRRAAGGPAAPHGHRVPRDLPHPCPAFAGRGRELAQLDRIAAAALWRGDRAAGLLIAAICGIRGAGKTTLAIRWAQLRTDAFPDAQLYIDLKGSTVRPIEPADALGRLLHALGVGAGQVPATVDERAARFRTVLAGRRALVVLDDARSAEQVRPLLPGSAGSMVIVTSRDSLAGLVAADGAHRLRLGALDAEDAGSLRRSAPPADVR